LERGRAWLDALLHGLDQNRTLLSTLVAEYLPQVKMVRREATYLTWLDCRSLGLNSPSDRNGPGVVSDPSGPAQMFLTEARVALSSGHVFGAGGDGSVRLNYATSATILRNALPRMGAAAIRPTQTPKPLANCA
jgi:cysteine-S-conjugate beta-lyase